MILWTRILSLVFLFTCLSAWSWSEPAPTQEPDFRVSVDSLVSDLKPTLSPWQKGQLTEIFKLYETQFQLAQTQVQTLSASLDKERKAEAQRTFHWQLAAGGLGLAAIAEAVLLFYQAAHK